MAGPKQVMNLGSVDQAMISSQSGGVCRQMTKGIMEWWSIGVLDKKGGCCSDFNF
jgi:hypothetical protein